MKRNVGLRTNVMVLPSSITEIHYEGRTISLAEFIPNSAQAFGLLTGGESPDEDIRYFDALFPLNRCTVLLLRRTAVGTVIAKYVHGRLRNPPRLLRKTTSGSCHLCGMQTDLPFVDFSVPKNAAVSTADGLRGNFKICALCVMEMYEIVRIDEPEPGSMLAANLD
jgi:hypothetical protein